MEGMLKWEPSSRYTISDVIESEFIADIRLGKNLLFEVRCLFGNTWDNNKFMTGAECRCPHFQLGGLGTCGSCFNDKWHILLIQEHIFVIRIE